MNHFIVGGGFLLQEYLNHLFIHLRAEMNE
jgi:hypothetical protein